MRLKSIPLVVVLLASLALPGAGAQDGPRHEAGVLAGGMLGDSQLVGSEKDDNPNPVVGARYGYRLSERAGLFVDGTFSRLQGQAEPGDLGALMARGGVELFVTPKKPWQTFVALGAGSAWYDSDTDSFRRTMASVGVGQKHVTTDGGDAFRWEVRFDNAGGNDGVGGAPLRNFLALVGYSWGFGGPPPDTDGDGVIDRKDACPDTPRGAVVDEKGCPKDSDGDGVWDGLDRCPDTPKGTPVDAAGCPKDTDGDGVHDGIDACPDTPKGAKVDARGCPTDSDGDGVWDGLDACPNTPKGAKVDARGCPTDADGDGVYDGLDRCPDTPRGTKVDANGCPPPAPKPAPVFQEGRKSLVLEDVQFDTDKATLKPESLAALDRVAESLVAWPEVKVQVGGHTDSSGSDAHNLRLSQARADAVMEYLRGKGVDASRLTARGFGEKSPIADNKTADGKAKNRRVELTKID